MHDKDKYLCRQREKKTAIILAARRRAKAAARYAAMRTEDVHKNVKENVLKGIDKRTDLCYDDVQQDVSGGCEMKKNINGEPIHLSYPEVKLITGFISDDRTMPEEWYKTSEERRLQEKKRSEELLALSREILADADVTIKAVEDAVWFCTSRR